MASRRLTSSAPSPRAQPPTSALSLTRPLVLCLMFTSPSRICSLWPIPSTSKSEAGISRVKICMSQSSALMYLNPLSSSSLRKISSRSILSQLHLTQTTSLLTRQTVPITYWPVPTVSRSTLSRVIFATWRPALIRLLFCGLQTPRCSSCQRSTPPTTWRWELRLTSPYPLPFFTAWPVSRNRFYIWTDPLRTRSTPLSLSMPARTTPSSPALTSRVDRPASRPSWATSWSVVVFALPVAFPTIILVTMTVRIFRKTSASNLRKFQKLEC